MSVVTVLYQSMTWLIILLTIIIGYYRWSFQYWKRRKVPYIEPTFPFGNYKYFLNRKYHLAETLTKYYRRMRGEGHKFCGFYLFALPCLLVTDPEIAKLIMTKDFQHFSNRSFFYNEKHDPISAHLLAVNGEKWRRMRSKMTPAFSSVKIKSMYKIIVECGNLLQRDLKKIYENEKVINTKEIFRSFTSNVIAVAAFGFDVEAPDGVYNDFKKFGYLSIDINKVEMIKFLLGSIFPKFCRLLRMRQIKKVCADYFQKTVKDMVEYRETTNTIRKDFLQLMINMKKKDAEKKIDFTTNEIAAQCFIFFLAGFETSATTICFAMYEIAKNQAIQERARQEIFQVLEKYQGEITYEAITEIKYVEQIIEETLRKYSPARYVTRLCTKDYRIPETDVILQKGKLVVIPIEGIHFDEEFYPNPEIFDPERFSDENKKLRPQYTWLPFGEGPRNCIGMRFGMLQTKIALLLCLSKFKYTVSSKTKEPIKMNPSVVLLHTVDDIFLDFEKIDD